MYPCDRHHVAIWKGACNYVALVQGKVRVCDDRGGWPIRHDVLVDHDDLFPKIGAGSMSLKGRDCGRGEH